MWWPWRSQSLLASLSGKILCSVKLRRSRVASLRSPCLACFVEGSACLCHAMACVVAMEITQSAFLTFWDVSLLRRTLTEQGRRPKKTMSGLFCGGICLSLSCDGLCGGHGDHKVCLPLSCHGFLLSIGHPTMPPTPGMVLPFIDLLQCMGVK